MPQPVPRWIEVTASPFAHESEGLNRVKAVLPGHAPFRAWSNLEFRDSHGKWHEVDLLVLGRRRLHLVELKYYSGTLRGDDHRWLRAGHRAEDSPLKLAHRKAQRLASKLAEELRRWSAEQHQSVPNPRAVLPYVQESVFLHHPDLRCELPPSSRLDLFGIDGAQTSTGLPGISERLLEPATSYQAVPAYREDLIAALLTRIGVVQRRQREVGSWIIDDQPLGEGPGWQDWPAFHRVATTDRNRIRFFVTAPGASTAEQQRVRLVADHEFRMMARLPHDGLLSPRDLVDGDLGVGLVYPDDPRLARLDLWLADQPAGVALADQLSVLRQVAEAVDYAHGNRVVHRGLTPRAVSVRRLPGGEVKAVVGDWQSAGATGPALTGLSSVGVTSLLGVSQSVDRLAALAGTEDPDRRTAEAFQAPEGVWNPQADRVRLDVFALGALAYYLLAGRPAAPNRAALKERLLRDGGLDLAADLPQVPSSLRTLVLAATRPAVSERLPDVRQFLALLAEAERALREPGEDATDPLDATPGTVLVGRFRVERRLGAGSTAVGLLVTDLGVAGADAQRVLKVALDDAAAQRLDGEAEVLGALDDPRLVRLVEGPLDLAGRRCLLLESAGEQTLAEVLRARARVSLDLLERWGGDLLGALVALDRAGVDHRDIKPANLGVREVRSQNRGDRTKHLVLFDFSLSRAGAGALNAGTPPYLDPFLEAPGRGRYDSAAERYAAGVVLFEMASGATPVYGDGLTDPGAVRDEASISEELFDESVAGALTRFFHRALARDARVRFDTAGDMAAAWGAVFAPVPKTMPDDAAERAEAAVPSTLLVDAGLSARALSALEPYAVRTVGDLVALDPVRLNRLSGVAEPTRREVKDRARRWRERLAALVTGRGPATPRPENGMPTPAEAADLLLRRAGNARAQARRAAARLILGLPSGPDAAATRSTTPGSDGSLEAAAAVDAFASGSELAAALGVTPGRASQHLSALQEAWAVDDECRALLATVATQARTLLGDLGELATVGELTAGVLAALTPMTTVEAGPTPSRLAAGLLRLALDRTPTLARADRPDRAAGPDTAAGLGVDGPNRAAGPERADGLGRAAGPDRTAGLDRASELDTAAGDPVSARRRHGRIAVLAGDPLLLDLAEALGRAADGLVAQARLAQEPVVPSARCALVLRETVLRAAPEPPDALIEDTRLLRLAAALSSEAQLSGADELHSRDLDPATALTLALGGIGGGQPVSVQELRDRVRARFPALPPLPDRPRLDELVDAAGLGLVFDEGLRAYRSLTRAADTTGLVSRQATYLAPLASAGVEAGHLGHRLDESRANRSFLALGVGGLDLIEAITRLKRDYGAVVLDLTSVLIEAMRASAAEVGLPWAAVRAADAAVAGSREDAGLRALVARALPAVDAAIEAFSAAAPPSTQPVLLTEAAPLARYGHLQTLARWTDLPAPRRQAIWLLVPQLLGCQGAVVDNRPLPLAAPGQFVRLDSAWLRPEPLRPEPPRPEPLHPEPPGSAPLNPTTQVVTS